MGVPWEQSSSLLSGGVLWAPPSPPVSAPVTQYKNPLPPGGCRAKSPEPSTRLGLSPAAQLSLSTVSPLAPRNPTPSPPHWVSVPSDSELGEQLRREPIQGLCASQAPTAPPSTLPFAEWPLCLHTPLASPPVGATTCTSVCACGMCVHVWRVCVYVYLATGLHVHVHLSRVGPLPSS